MSGERPRYVLDSFALLAYLAAEPGAAQVQPVSSGVPWLGFVVYPTHRLLKRRNVVNFARRFAQNLDLFRAGRIPFAELDASVQGWINHVRYGDIWGLRRAVLGRRATAWSVNPVDWLS